MSSVAFLDARAPASTRNRGKKVHPRTSAREGIFTEIVGFDELLHLKFPWADLVRRALEPNVFLEPSFAIPLYQHCHNRAELKFLLAWKQEGTDFQHQMIGLLPLTLPRFVLTSFARSQLHALAPLGTPLFDRDRGAEAFQHMLSWFHDHHPRVKGLVLPLIPKDGATFSMLQVHAETTKHKLTIFREHLRAVLTKVVASDAFPNRFISSKRRNNYRQQRRRLSRNGEVTYRTIKDPGEIRQAAELFLSLEFKGWKGARRTALLAASAETTFFRAMTRMMASEGKCRIDSLDIGDKPVAMGVVLSSGDRDFYWKTTYDERFAPFSPGVQLTLELTHTQLTQPSVTLTDSCAIPNHPMMDHIWRERIPMTNVLVRLHHTRGIFFTLDLWQEIAYHSLRSMAKFVLKRILRRRH